VQSAAFRPRQSAVRDRGMELRKLGLKLFIDQQKRLQSAPDITVASGHDFIDGGLM
jgi:hypothetical protein